MQYNMNPDNKLNNRKVRKVVYIFIAVVLFLTFFSSTLNNITLPVVKAEKFTYGMLLKRVEGEAIVESKETYEVYSETALKVKELKVSSGEQVKKGQTIMVLDTKELKEKLENEQLVCEQKRIDLEKLSNQSTNQAKKGDRNAQAALMKVKLAEKNLKNMKALYEAGAESLQNVDKAQTEFKTLQDEYDSLVEEHQSTLTNQQLDIKKMQLDLTAENKKVSEIKKQLAEMDNIVAPFDGSISELNAMKGSATDSGKPLFRMADDSNGMQARLTIESYRAKWLSVGDAAFLANKSSGEDSIEGKISGILDNPKDKENLKDILIDFDMKGLKGGEHINATIKKEAGPFNIIIPKEALHEDVNGTFVYVTEERKGPLGTEYNVRKKNIKVIDSSDTQVALQDGLLLTDYIIKNSDKAITEGTRVKLEKSTK